MFQGGPQNKRSRNWAVDVLSLCVMGTHESWWPPCSSYSDTVCFYVLLYKTCSHLVPTILSFILIAHREKLFFCKFHTTLVVYTPVFCQYFWHHLAHCFFLQISEAILTRSLKMQNEAGEYVDLYIPRYGVVRVYAFACCTFYARLECPLFENDCHFVDV